MKPDRDARNRHYRTTADAVTAELKRHPKVVGIAICGSLVTGDLWEESDIDLLVVLRNPEADWEALTVCHEGIQVHLQLLSQDFLVSKSEGLRGGLISQVLSVCDVVYDPECVVQQAVKALTEYPGEKQVHNTITHLIAFLGEYNAARKCLEGGYTEDAFLHTTIAFQALAHTEFARQGRYNQRLVMESLVTVAPHLYNAFVWFVHGRPKVTERIRRSFSFFERSLDRVLGDVGPAVVALLRACKRPVSEERLGELPLIYDRSPNLTCLAQRLVEHGMVRPDIRSVEIQGVTLTTLSERLFDLF